MSVRGTMAGTVQERLVGMSLLKCPCAWLPVYPGTGLLAAALPQTSDWMPWMPLPEAQGHWCPSHRTPPKATSLAETRPL